MSRRSLGVLATLSLAASLVVVEVAVGARDREAHDPPRAVQASARQVALGISIWPGRDLGRLDAFTSAIGGHAPATWTIWSQWGSPVTREFPLAQALGARSRGAIPMIWWEPVNPGDLTSPEYARLQHIAAGAHDDYIRRFARDARDFASPIILRFAHEPNGGTFPWGVTGFDNTADAFVAAWRHVHGIFQDEGARHVRFLWSVGKKKCPGGCDPYRAFYPGDAFVDYMGFSSFNWGADRGKWVSMLQGFSGVTATLSDISSKPIIAVEAASNARGGDKAAWIQDGYREVYRQLPEVVAIVYLDADLRPLGHPDWRLATPAEALEAYAEIARLPRFQGRLAG